MILRGSDGRLRTGWRLGLFVMAFVVFLAVINQLAEWLGAPWITGAWPERWIFLTPLLAALLASWLMMEVVEGKPLAAIGVPLDRLTPRSLGAGALLGVLLVGVVVLTMVLVGALTWAPQRTSAGQVALALTELSVFMALAAFAEELLLRGYPLQVLTEAMGGRAAVLVSAVLFAGLHALNPHVSVLALVNIGLAGILLGAALLRTMSLWFVTGLHFGWNWVMGVAADLPVSGMDASVPGFALDTPGIEAVPAGAAALTGGAFGPEGSWLVTGATVAGILWVVSGRRLRPALRVLALRPPSVRWRLRSAPDTVSPAIRAAEG